MAKHQSNTNIPALFTLEDARDPFYKNVRDGTSESCIRAREDCERRWHNYYMYCDRDFLIQIRSNFQERWWEMYLTTALIDLGYEVHCPKPGPDVGIVHNGQRIWFEAVTPGPGTDGHPDRVPDPRGGEFEVQPTRQMLLRLTSAVTGKLTNQFESWRDNGIVGDSDCYLVAVNTYRFQGFSNDGLPPLLLRAAYGIGDMFAAIDRTTGSTTHSGYQSAPISRKSSGRSVDCDLFRRFRDLSGLITSPISAGVVSDCGAFRTAPNPFARVRLPADFHLPGCIHNVRNVGGEINVDVRCACDLREDTWQ